MNSMKRKTKTAKKPARKTLASAGSKVLQPSKSSTGRPSKIVARAEER